MLLNIPAASAAGTLSASAAERGTFNLPATDTTPAAQPSTPAVPGAGEVIIRPDLPAGGTVADSGGIARGPIAGGVVRGGVIERGPIMAPGLRLAGMDFAKDVQALQTQQKELVKLKTMIPNATPGNQKFSLQRKSLTDHLNAPEISADPNNAVVVKSMLSDIHAITGMIHSKTLKSKATALSKKANAINAKFLI